MSANEGDALGKVEQCSVCGRNVPDEEYQCEICGVTFCESCARTELLFNRGQAMCDTCFDRY